MKTIVLLAFIIIFFSGCSPRQEIINPYENQKDFPYKASLHNHSNYHPEWSHAPVPSCQRLRDYLYYDTDPEYGIVSITEHTRVTAPWNTVPSGIVEESDAPWGVEGILWIPGNESVIGNRERGGIFGELLIINPSTEQTDEIDWIITENDSTRSGWLYTSRDMLPSVELTFTGVGFRWIARTDPDGGIAAVYLDGEKVGEANLYTPGPLFNQEIFSLGGLDKPLVCHFK